MRTRKVAQAAVVALVLLAATNAVQAWLVPRCYVEHCRFYYGQACLTCIGAMCGNDAMNDPRAAAFCNGRPIIRWPRPGQPGGPPVSIPTAPTGPTVDR